MATIPPYPPSLTVYLNPTWREYVIFYQNYRIGYSLDAVGHFLFGFGATGTNSRGSGHHPAKEGKNEFEYLGFFLHTRVIFHSMIPLFMRVLQDPSWIGILVSLLFFFVFLLLNEINLIITLSSTISFYYLRTLYFFSTNMIMNT